MAFSNAQKVWKITMRFDGVEGGWSESAYLADASMASLLASALAVCQYRLVCLPPQQKMVYAKISEVGTARDRRMVQMAFPAAGLWPGESSGSPAVVDPQTVTVNSDEDAIQYTAETADGAWLNRWMHGIPDAYVNSEEITAAITEAASPAPAIGTLPGSSTWFELVGIYLRVIQDNTVFYRSLETANQTFKQTDTIASIIFRKYGWHKVGAFFGQRRGRAVPR